MSQQKKAQTFKRPAAGGGNSGQPQKKLKTDAAPQLSAVQQAAALIAKAGGGKPKVKQAKAASAAAAAADVTDQKSNPNPQPKQKKSGAAAPAVSGATSASLQPKKNKQPQQQQKPKAAAGATAAAAAVPLSKKQQKKARAAAAAAAAAGGSGDDDTVEGGALPVKTKAKLSALAALAGTGDSEDGETGGDSISAVEMLTEDTEPASDKVKLYSEGTPEPLCNFLVDVADAVIESVNAERRKAKPAAAEAGKKKEEVGDTYLLDSDGSSSDDENGDPLSSLKGEDGEGEDGDADGKDEKPAYRGVKGFIKFMSELSENLTQTYTEQRATRRFRKNVLAWITAANEEDDAAADKKSKKNKNAAAEAGGDFDFGGVKLNFSAADAASIELPTLKLSAAEKKAVWKLVNQMTINTVSIEAPPPRSPDEPTPVHEKIEFSFGVSVDPDTWKASVEKERDEYKARLAAKAAKKKAAGGGKKKSKKADDDDDDGSDDDEGDAAAELEGEIDGVDRVDVPFEFECNMTTMGGGAGAGGDGEGEGEGEDEEEMSIVDYDLSCRAGRVLWNGPDEPPGMDGGEGEDGEGEDEHDRSIFRIDLRPVKYSLRHTNALDGVSDAALLEVLMLACQQKHGVAFGEGNEADSCRADLSAQQQFGDGEMGFAVGDDDDSDSAADGAEGDDGEDEDGDGDDEPESLPVQVTKMKGPAPARPAVKKLSAANEKANKRALALERKAELEAESDAAASEEGTKPFNYEFEFNFEPAK